MIHDPILHADVAPPPVSPAPPQEGLLYELVLYFRAPAVRHRLEVAILLAAALLAALIASGFVRAWLAGRL